jgi:hypothetical protein
MIKGEEKEGIPRHRCHEARRRDSRQLRDAEQLIKRQLTSMIMVKGAKSLFGIRVCPETAGG